MKETDSDYFRQVYKAVSELLAVKRADEDTREAELEQLRQEIVGLEQMLSAVAPFTSGMKVIIGDVAIVDGIAGLTLAEAIRKILDHHPQARTARGVRDSLFASGYDLSQHNNPLASIHGVLKRMADSGEIDTVEVNGRIRYRSKARTIGRFNESQKKQIEDAIKKPVTGFSGVSRRTVELGDTPPSPVGQLSAKQILELTKKGKK